MNEPTKKSNKDSIKRNRQGLTFCRPDHKTVHLARTNACPDCGFRIRSENHNEGMHHLQGKEGRCRVK